MATKKTNTKNTKKTVTKNEEQPVKKVKETNNAEEMSVEELTKMFIQNDTQTIERLKTENAPEPPMNASEQTVQEKENKLEKILDEVVGEQPKNEPKPKSATAEAKAIEKKKQEPEQPKVTQKPQQANTNRAVYGYDHFGIIYGY